MKMSRHAELIQDVAHPLSAIRSARAAMRNLSLGKHTDQPVIYSATHARNCTSSGQGGPCAENVQANLLVKLLILIDRARGC
jgi:hypothetical protein